MSSINKICSSISHCFHLKECKKFLTKAKAVMLKVFQKGIFWISFHKIDWQKRKVSSIKESNESNVSNLVSPILKGDQVASKSFNNNSSKVTLIKQAQSKQMQQFRTWEQANKWQSIHDAHYDWWMFPVDRPSQGHGDKYAVNQQDIDALKADPAFMDSYRNGVSLVVRAWGWDLEKGQAISTPQSGQRWTGYGVRLAKMSDSLLLFGETELHRKLQVFFNQHCLAQQDKVPISNLDWCCNTLLN